MVTSGRRCFRPAISCVFAVLVAACSVACMQITIAFPPPSARLFCRLCDITLHYQCDSAIQEFCDIVVSAQGLHLSSHRAPCSSSNHTHLIDVTRLSHDAEKVEFNARLSCEHVQPAAVASVHYTLSPLPQSAPANVPANAAVEISRLPLQEGLVAGVSSTIISNMLHAFPIFRGPRGAFLPSIVLLSCPRAAAAASASATALQPTETA